MQIMKISMSFDFVLRVLSHIGNEQTFSKTTDLSKSLKIPYNHLIKIIHKLSKENIIYTKRGKDGGVIMPNSSKNIPLNKLYQLFEPNHCIHKCIQNPSSCSLYNGCEIVPIYSDMQNSINQILNKRKVKDIIRKK